MRLPARDELVVRSIATFVGLAGTTVALVWLSLSMRAVLAVGGSCASGGPYEIATPCPHGTVLTTLGAFFGGIVGVGVYAVFGLRAGPRVTLLVWSALFLSLGWNFLDALRHAGDSAGGTGWLICAVLFAVMGLAPLATLFFPGAARTMFWSDGEDPRVRQPVVAAAPADPQFRMPAYVRPAPSHEAPPDDVATALTRLAELHDRGALSDEEYRSAKRRILEDR